MEILVAVVNDSLIFKVTPKNINGSGSKSGVPNFS